MVIILILIIGTASGYDFKCPTQAQWRIRANVSCYSEDKYVCLFNLLDKKYEDNCSGSDLSSKGSKLVFQPLFNLAKCNADRYQPIVFSTHGNSECMFLKSKCDEEGQILYRNGSSRMDTTCRCDFTQGFAFVSTPKHICFCTPSEEDCSCFKARCSKLSSDYQCSTEGQMIDNTNCRKIHPHISHKQHNKTVQYIEIVLKNYAFQVTYYILSIMAVCIVITVLTVCVNLWMHPYTNIEEKQRFIHQRLLEGERGKHYFARVMLIGKNGVGKTSLMRRLLWQKREDVTSPDSTDGIEIEKCDINIKNGEWRPCDKIDDDLTRLIRQVFTDEKMNEEKVSKQSIGEYVNVTEHMKYNTCYDESNAIQNDISRVDEKIYKESSESQQKLTIGIQKEKGDIQNQIEPVQIEFEQSNMHISNKEQLSKYDAGPDNDENIDKMTFAILQSNLTRKASKIKDTLAFCWLWDFAGQKDFYATHQVFLSKCAVFLLVTDSLEFSTAENLWTEFDDSAKYVNFWIDAIHCYWSTSEYGRLDPPIIVVCTNEDKCKDISARQKRREDFKENLGRVLSRQKKKDHLRSIYFISNTKDDDNVFENIRNDISRHAMNMNDWGRDCPLKWLLFQQVLGKLKESDVPISTTTKLQKIAKHDDIGITNADDFKLCLQYCHDNGTIIYFDEDILKDHVILDPKWLVDAFRCLVSDKIENVIMISDDWGKLRNTGELTHSLISVLFRKEPRLKFFENKTHLLEVMKRFDIVVNLKNSTALYMPCMMQSCSFSEVQKQFLDGCQGCHKTSWLCLEFRFLPPSFFNHIIVWYIKQFSVSVILEKETHMEKKALYRKICVFDLDSSRCEQLIVCEGPNVIALQIWDSRMSDKTYGYIETSLVQYVESLRKRYNLQISFTKSFKCKDGEFITDRKQMKDLVTLDYRCFEHLENHLSDDLVKPWNLRTELQSVREETRLKQKECLRDIEMLRETNTYCEACKNVTKSKAIEYWMEARGGRTQGTAYCVECGSLKSTFCRN